MAVTINSHGISRLAAGPVAEYVDGKAKRVLLEAKNRAPNFTGRLRASVSKKTTVLGYKVSSKIETKTGYGLFVEEGTGIYGPKNRVIRPKTKPFLVFQPRWLGHVIRVKSVKGQPGQHYMKSALLAVFKKL